MPIIQDSDIIACVAANLALLVDHHQYKRDNPRAVHHRFIANIRSMNAQIDTDRPFNAPP